MFKKYLRRIVPYLFYASIILFLGLYVRTIDFKKLSELHFNWFYILVATVFGLIFRYFGVYIWCVIIRTLGSASLPPFLLMSYIYAKAWMGRYIPGTVPWIASKIYMASNQGISKSRLTVSSILEGGMQVVSITIISLLLLGFDSRTNVLPTGLKIFMVFFGLCLLIIISPPVFNRFMRLAHLVFKKGEPGQELRINRRATVISFILYAINGIISGVSYFYITKSIEPNTSYSMLLYLIGSFNLAGALGMAAPFVPSGLGVRDGAQLVLLSAVFPKEVALLVTVFSRLWSVVVDVLFYAVATAIYHMVRPQSAVIEDNST